MLVSEREGTNSRFVTVNRIDPTLPIDSLDLVPEHQTLTPELHLNLGYTRLLANNSGP